MFTRKQLLSIAAFATAAAAFSPLFVKLLGLLHTLNTLAS